MVMARAMCGSVRWMKRLTNPAPSISAASFCSLSSDCSEVSRISVANGSHCQATMMMIDSSG